MTKWVGFVTAGLLLCGQGKADDLLYATDGKALYTVDLTSGGLTFQSDGVLQWLASPAFDDQHHTRLWVQGNEPGGIGWLPGGGASFFYGNPTTGEYGGPYPTTVTPPSMTLALEVSFLNNAVVYAPSTERLYAIGVLGNNIGSPDWNSFGVALVDQYGGVPPNDWIGELWVAFTRTGQLSSVAAAFDPFYGFIVVGYSVIQPDAPPVSPPDHLIAAPWSFPIHGGPFPPSNWVIFAAFWPGDGAPGGATGRWWWIAIEFPDAGPVGVQALAIHPKTGQLYALFNDPRYSGVLLARITPLNLDTKTDPTITEIGVLPYGNWQMTFAGDKYVR